MAAAAVERPGAPPPAQQRYQGVQKESAGYRLLSAMGWREGEGLGASKQGIKSHIKVKKKFENWGVGALEAQHAQNWTNGMLDFHRVLSNLSEVVSEHAKRRASSDDDSDASGGSDGERGQQQQQQQPAPRPAAKPSADSGGASSSSSSSSEEEQGAAAPKRVRAATHIGRFKKREAAKMVKAYSEHDLAAILGADPFAAAAAAVPEVRAQHAASSGSGYDSDEESEGEEAAAQRPRKRQKGQGEQGSGGAPRAEERQQSAQLAAAPDAQPAAPPKPAMIVVRRPMPASCRPAQPATPQESRQPGWWQVCFHRAAGPGGAGAGAGVGASSAAAITIHGFSEQDQTNLYNLAHDKATQGRVGLGRSSMPKKVAGARWEGKKTRIQDSDDDDEEDAAAAAEGEAGAPAWQRQRGPEVGPAPGGVELEREEGLVIVLPASKRHLLDALPDCHQQQPPAAQQHAQQQAAAAAPSSGKKASKKARRAAAAATAQAAQQQAAASAGGADLAQIKWRKPVSAALKASSKGQLKLGKLARALAKELGVAKAQRPAAHDALAAFLRTSTKFQLQDGVVRLA